MGPLYWLERHLDEKWKIRGADEAPMLRRSPTEYVQQGNWFFHTEADEKMLPYTASVIGAEQALLRLGLPPLETPQSPGTTCRSSSPVRTSTRRSAATCNSDRERPIRLYGMS